MTRHPLARKSTFAYAPTARRGQAWRLIRHHLRRLYRGLNWFLRGLWDGMGRYDGPRGL